MDIKLFAKLLFPLCLLSSCGTTSGSSISSEQIDSEEDRVMHDHSVYDNGVKFDSSLWKSPSFKYEENKDKNENIKALYIRSDFNGNESYAFAYLGYPSVKKDKYPAVLLLHGGGGTAYYEWVREWANRGYIALALDLEGHTPKENGTLTSAPNELYEKSPYVAPYNQNLADENADLSKTWLYYACKTAIIGNSFLHNLDKVDKNKIGVCGVSWGGFITSIITGYDDRFAFSLPIYCTVGLEDSGSPLGEYIKSHPTFKVFDKVEPLLEIETPLHYFVSGKDKFANPYMASDVILGMKNSGISIYPDLLHSQYDATNLMDPYTYADRLLNGYKEIEITLDSGSVKITNNNNTKINSVSLYTTEDNLPSTSSRWLEEELSLDGDSSTFTLDSDTSYYYVSVLDEKGAITSSKVLKNR